MPVKRGTNPSNDGSRRSKTTKNRAGASNDQEEDEDVEDQPTSRQAQKKTAKQQVAAPDPDRDIDDEDEGLMEVEDEEGGLRIGDIYIPPPPAPVCTFETNGPRLIITHITNENFKSYAGKEILGPFHKCFTSIVGPNGSGKSNVIDSMLFVFGYRANKIRSKKISVLLHNSAKFPNIQSCTVSVHFQQIIDKPAGDEFEIVPNSDFVISRTAFKDSKSFYEIDGRRVQFKEVAKLLRHHGIDLVHNRFLILQGEVEQIAMMKPKAPSEHETGMLEYLEDIIGSSRYKEPTEKLQQCVELLNDQRAEKLNRVKLVEKEKDDLQGPRDKAMAYVGCENRITEYKHVQQQLYRYDALMDLEKAEEEKKSFDEELSDLTDALEKITLRKAAKAKEYEAVINKRAKAKAKFEKANDEFTHLETEDNKLSELVKVSNENRNKLRKTLALEIKKLEECQRAPAKNEGEIQELGVLKTELEKKRAKEEEAVAKILASLNKETEGLQKDKDKLEAELLDLKKTVNETQSDMNVAESELDIYLSKEKNEKATLEKMQETYNSAKLTIEEYQRNITLWEKEGPKKQALVKKTQSEMETLTKEETFLDEEIRRVRSQLEEGRSSMAASHSRGRVLDALMEQKAKGTLPGIFGRLGDLGGINEKYDVAISTACGQLDNIVVDTVDTAELCVQFLRKHSLGLASFIVLDKMERWRDNANAKIRTPENVNRLYDLVQIQDERVKTAFYYALRDTLVADDLEQASRIAYGQVRHRVVTLKGDVIEPSGTMSGGGKSVSRGRMGRQVRTNTAGNGLTANELQVMEGRMNSYVEKMQHLREKKGELQRQVTTLSEELKEAHIDKWTTEIKALKEKASTIEGQLKAQEKQVKDAKPDQNKVNNFEAAIATKRKRFDEATAKASKVEDKVQKLRDQIEDITGGQVKAAQEKLESVVKKLDKVAADMSRLSVAVKTAERNAKKSADKIENLKQEINEIQEEMKTSSKRQDEIEKLCNPLMEKQKEFKKELAEAEEQAVEIKKELDVIVQDEKKVKASKIEFDQKTQKILDRIAQNKGRIAHAEREMAKLKLHHFDGEEPKEFRELPIEELENMDRQKLKYQVEIGEDELRNQKPNLAAIEEYRKKEEAYLTRVAELDDITRSRDEQRQHVDNLCKARLNEFMVGFGLITMKLKEMYQMITMGGDAELELLDSLDPFTEGIVFSVRPPKKSWKNISNLSGGEKTLSSLALVFALHYYKPTPLYVMDEIDAALDYKNVSIVGHYIKERTKNAQFIVISLRSNMFELADRLVGIYKVQNCTHSVSINPKYYDDDGANSGPVEQLNPESSDPVANNVRAINSEDQTQEPEEVMGEK